jgi:hypothetical protein
MMPWPWAVGDFPNPIKSIIALRQSGTAMTSGLIPVSKRTLTPAQYGEPIYVPRAFLVLSTIHIQRWILGYLMVFGIPPSLG